MVLMKRIGILGSTGSIGQNALKVIENLQDSFQVTVLAAKSSIDLLEVQAKKFRPEVVAVYDEESAIALQERLPEIPVLSGEDGILAAASESCTDMVLSAMAGFDGVLPTLKAIEAGKEIALANKEALVAGGSLVTSLAREYGVPLIPVDSEHTAIFQCLKGEELKDVRRIILTASGGPFREYSSKQLHEVDVDSALAHPNYSMGSKVSVDSSTMMNKGLEMIETHYLYGVPIEQIEIVVHPEQVLHSMVEFVDGSVMAQMGEPDMLIPIQVALTHPERMKGLLPPFDFTKYATLNFSVPDTDKFRCVELAYNALKEGGSMPCFMNAANEILVHRFLRREIRWLEIGQKLESLMQKHQVATPSHFDDLAFIDNTARELARRI